MSDKKIWLDCPVCGEEVFESDEDGLFWEDTDDVCPGCGTMCQVRIREADDYDPEVDGEVFGTAYVETGDEEVMDVGQPKCDGTCGSVKEFVGTPCRWNCDRAMKALKEGSWEKPGEKTKES